MSNLPVGEILSRRLSLLVCTRNRRQPLAELFNSLIRLRIPSGWSLELVIVDNGSTDGTAQTIAGAAKQLPFAVQTLFEPKPGLGRAHAAALAACRGELVACTDDDCLVPEDWCEAIVAAFESRPEWGGLFGRVLPHQEEGASVWRIAVKVSEKPEVFRFPCRLIMGFGNNMVFRRTALESAGGFNSAFGPGGALWSAEELELAYRMLRAGWQMAYEPSVQLYHRARTTFEGWKTTHIRDALGIGAFSGSYGIRGHGYALKFGWWNWVGMLAAFFRGLFGADAQKRQVGGWYVLWLPLGFMAGVWHSLRQATRARAGRTLVQGPPRRPSEKKPAVSAVICTRNRAGFLREALESLLASEGMPDDAFEIIVADNGSHDTTYAVISEIQRRARCAVTYAYEPRAGVSFAKNTAVRLSQARVVALTDDDCVVAKDWLRQVLNTFERNQDVSGFCGRVLPHGGAVTDATVSIKTDETARRFRFPCSPFIGHGNNIAFLREALEAIGLFDEAFGPGSVIGSADEWDVNYRLLRSGCVLAYEPAGVVFHRSRLTPKEARSVEWRNALALGACFAKHGLNGDGFVLKQAYWMMASFPSDTVQFWQQGRRQDLARRWLFFVGIPCGMLRWVVFCLSGGRKRLCPCPA